MSNDNIERYIELKLGLVKDELNRAWQQVDRQGDIRFKIKAWCTTAWLASFAIYGKNIIDHYQAAVLIFISIFAFFLIELYWVYIGAIWNKRKSLIEKLLSTIGQTEDRDEIKTLLINFPSPGLYQSAINLKDKFLYAELLCRPSIILP